MESIQSINPQRIEWCCADHGITPNALADQLGISQKRMQELLNEGKGLTIKQLSKVAKYFGRGLLFFLEQEPVEPVLFRSATFRTLANQKPDLSNRIRMLIERVEKHQQLYLSLESELSDNPEPLFQPIEVSSNDIAHAAKAARKWLGLGKFNHFASYRAAIEAKGILVFKTNGYAGHWQIAKESPIAGFSLYNENCPVIVVKKMRSEAAQAFTLMHELGHVLLHKSSWIDEEDDLHSSTDQEIEANLFAGLVLVPGEYLSQVNDASRPKEVERLGEWLKPLRDQLGVSNEVLLRRLMDEGRLPSGIYKAYRDGLSKEPIAEKVQRGARLTRYREPYHVFGDRYVRLVLDSLSAKHITLSKACSYLDGIKIADVHRLGEYCAQH